MVVDLIQNEYIELLSSQIEGLVKKSDREYNFRCPFCGDSKVSKIKKRGWLVKKNNKWFYYCFNCNVSYTFNKFLEVLDKELYRRYILDVLSNKEDDTFIINSYNSGVGTSGLRESLFLEKDGQHSSSIEGPVRSILEPLSSLSYSSPAFIYLRHRNIDVNKFNNVYYTEEFRKFIKENIPGKYDDVEIPDEGIVFKLYDLEHNIMGFQIRNIRTKDKSRRFMTCSIGDSHGYFYCGCIDRSKTYVVVEGPVDALSLDNGIAVLNSSLYKFQKGLNCIYFNDQEPYNKEVDKQIRCCIDSGLRTVLLPKEFFGMDVNDIRCKYPDLDINKLVEENSYTGLEAKLMYSRWKNQ